MGSDDAFELERSFAALAQGPCDVFVTDYEMPNVDGVQLLSKVRAQYPQVRRVVLSGRPMETTEGLPPTWCRLGCAKPSASMSSSNRSRILIDRNANR